jgi:hypothetical protein
MCGCGVLTSTAIQDDPRNGILKGQHRRFLKSHHLKGIPRSQEVRDRISAANKASASTGEDNRRWKGGVQLRRGRKYLLVGTDHPMAKGSGGYVAEYRLVMAAKLGRNLETWEQVHHIDLDPGNNDPANLVILSRSEHMRIHQRIRKGASPIDVLSLIETEQA